MRRSPEGKNRAKVSFSFWTEHKKQLSRSVQDQACSSDILKVMKADLMSMDNEFMDCILFGRTPWEIRGIKENAGGNIIKLREESYPTIDVVPEKYWDEIKDVPRIIEKYKVKVPFWWYSKHADQFYSEEDKYKKYVICCTPYSKEYGFDLKMNLEDSDSCIIC